MRMNIFKGRILGVLVLFCLGGNVLAQTIIYVDGDAPGLNDGSSWENAFRYLQDGLAAAENPPLLDEVRVAQGVYKPDEDSDNPEGTGDQAARFELMNDVTVKGGFAGYGEADPDDWDYQSYETILSGDLDGDDGPNFANYGENSQLVVYAEDLEETAVINGFTISGGNGTNGGGMYNIRTSTSYLGHCRTRIFNCTFKDNGASYGGGVYNFGTGSHPVFMNCSFVNNIAAQGGGVNNSVHTRSEFIHCTFRNNWAQYGGGMYCRYTDEGVTLDHCIFQENEAKFEGGGLHCDLEYNYVKALLQDCEFIGNTSPQGGGIYSKEENILEINRCLFENNGANEGGGLYSGPLNQIEMNSCLFKYNFASYGGGICNKGPITNHTLRRCRFLGNKAVHGGGIANIGLENREGYQRLYSCIFTGNVAELNGGGMYNKNYYDYVMTPILQNCTFVTNLVKGEGHGGGLYNSSDYIRPAIHNCIFWENTDMSLFGRPKEIQQIYGGLTTVKYSCIQDDLPDDNYIPFGGVDNYNIDDDPLLVRATGLTESPPVLIPPGWDWWEFFWEYFDFGDLHLTDMSPCIDMGNPELDYTRQEDIDGQPRVKGVMADMGADEFGPEVHVILPAGSEFWASGSRHEIQWQTYATEGCVNLLYSGDNGIHWSPIALCVENSGHYQWVLPDILASNECLVKVDPNGGPSYVEIHPSGVFTVQPYNPDLVADSAWPTLGGGATRTGLSESCGPELGCTRWRFETGGPVYSSVAIGPDEKIHIACEDGILYTVDADSGDELWRYETDTALLSSPTVGPDGTVYVGDDKGRLHAINKDGELRWQFRAKSFIYATPIVLENGTILVGSADGRLYALAVDGSLLWSYHIPADMGAVSAPILASPTIGKDGNIYVSGYMNSKIIALNPQTGSEVWSCNLGAGKTFASQVVADDGTIYVTQTRDMHLYRIDPDDGTIVAVTDLIADAHLINHWRFDETEGLVAHDSAGDDDGSLMNMNGNEWIEGVYGNALYFDGADDYIEMPIAEGLHLEQLTVSAWIKSYYIYGNYESSGTIIHCMNESHEILYRIAFHLFYLPTLHTSLITNESSTYLWTPLYAIDWAHVAITYDGTICILYVNGILIDRKEVTGIVHSDESVVINIGGYIGEFTSLYQGFIDDVRVYDRALSEGEMLNFYITLADSLGRSGVGSDTELSLLEDQTEEIGGDMLVGHWPLDESEGTIANDSVLHNDGILINGPQWHPSEGRIDGALEFDGVDDYIQIEPADVLNVRNIKMSAWVKLNCANPNRLMFILNRQMTEAGTYALFINENNKWGARIRSDETETYNVVIYSDAPATGEWTHIEATYYEDISLAEPGGFRLYINGQLQSDIKYYGYERIDPDNPGVLTIGSHPSGNYFFEGLIDDVRIYDPRYTSEYFVKSGWSEPVIAPDGTVYVSLDDPYLRAINPNGSIKWSKRLGVVGGFTLTVDQNGLIYAACEDGSLYVVNSQGEMVSRFDADNWLSYPVIGPDGTIYLSDADNRVWAIHEDSCLAASDKSLTPPETVKGVLNRINDFNGDRMVNLMDFAMLAESWLSCTDRQECENPDNQLYLPADIDRNLHVEIDDLFNLMENWLE